MSSTHLVLGGARSGKSGFSEQQALILANDTNKRCMYIATATADDQEMHDRIERHKNDRASIDWHVTECPVHLSRALEQATNTDVVLVDCLTLWLSNCLLADKWPREKDRFLIAMQDCPADLVLVSNEVGSGIVPIGALSRKFVDELGWLHQEVAKISDQVTYVIAGLPNKLK